MVFYTLRRNSGFAAPGTLMLLAMMGIPAAEAGSGWQPVLPMEGSEVPLLQLASQPPTELAQARGASGQGQRRIWSYSLNAFLYYDSFESDDDLIKSNQLSEYFVLSASQGNLWSAGDSLSLTGKFGLVQAWPERAGIDDSADATPTDIFLSAAYSTWDKKTSGFTAEVYVNIPTGPTDFSLAELAAIPNPKLVSVPILSDGLQLGTELQYHRQLDRWHLHGGVGYLFRTGISGFDVFRVDELSGGHDVSAIFGADYQLSERLNFGATATYTHSFEERGPENDFVSVSVPLTYLFERGEASVTYTFSFSSAENRELTRIRRTEDTLDFLDGLRHTLGVNVGYKLSDPLLVKVFAEGSVADTSRSDDIAFFTTDDYLVVGIGGTYALAQNLGLQGVLKYFDVSTKGANGGTTTFEGVSAMLGVKYAF